MTQRATGSGNGLAGRCVLITGCSSGIGHHAAHALKARGWRVIATCRSEADAARLTGEGLESFALDLASTDSIAAGVDRTLEMTGGRLDALFNNGAYAQPGAVEDLPTDALRAIFEVNFFGWHEVTRRVLPVMRRQRSGRIVQNSSVLGFVALRMRGAYNSTKFALEGYTDTLRLELEGTGIHVALLEPGPVRTRIRQNARKHYERWIDREGSPWAAFYRETLEPRLYAGDDAARDPGELTCEATTKAVIHALEAKNPRLHYPVTTPTWAMAAAKRLFPPRIVGRIARRI
ncbi:MAG: SDR family NAD(P)-dependent oxidoreductase [Pseudomonadota bacterium]